ncbi:uncharacterized protein B0T15DRAFT_513566 [Chaetomium strumarium]|uniref:Peroxin 20 n=1 Tax=Chaetomium strumarium TaxID=1170767 RepID=A0AAJ0GP94_9PEZI|nr:hypothetical protein B0T15DRAFT_513566 [Chaetomium strumarium]
MADNMCGPSNGAKDLLAHADRDRTIHQDRLVNAPQAGPGNAFRSQLPVDHGAAEMAFGNFQEGGAPMDATFNPGLHMTTVAPIGHHAPGAPAYGPPAVGTPMSMGYAGPSAPAARLASPLIGSDSHQEWVNQFARMQVAPGAAGPGTAMPNHLMNPAMRLQSAPFGAPMLGGAPPALLPFHGPVMNAGTQEQAQVGPLQDNAALIDDEAFNRAFDEYDDVFVDQSADWEEKQKLANTEFIKAQDQWMAEHGPRAESKRVVTPPTAEEMKVIDADLEKIAQEQDKKRSEDELARAAGEIVNSVIDDDSDKFKNSRFFELMRRIRDREVVIAGDNFVDTATGEKVEQSHSDEGDSGFNSEAIANGESNGAGSHSA